MATTTTKEPVVNKIELQIHEIEEKSVIINIQGWRIRAYFDNSLKKEQKELFTVGRTITVEYTGDIEDIHSIKLLPLK
ncbi:hypothetical protein D3C84_1124240 [compost metagenome]